MMWREQQIMLIQPSMPILSPLTLTASPSAPDFPTKFSSVTNSMFLKCIFQQPARFQGWRSDAAFAEKILFLEGFHHRFDVRFDRGSHIFRLRRLDRAGPDDFVLA